MADSEGYLRWSRWTATGTPSQIDGMLAKLDKGLPVGWKRLSDRDLTWLGPYSNKDAAWYSIDTTPDLLGVGLAVERRKPTVLQGGRALLLGPKPTTRQYDPEAAWKHADDFLSEVIAPAARAAGAEFKLPNAAEVFFSDLPFQVRESLQTFAAGARKSLPLDRSESKAWGEFVIAAFRSRTVIDADLLVAWFVTQGWVDEEARELSARFFDECRLLSQFADEVLTV